MGQRFGQRRRWLRHRKFDTKVLTLPKQLKVIKELLKLTQEIEELYEDKERNYEAEVKTIVANLKQALKKGANKNTVA